MVRHSNIRHLLPIGYAPSIEYFSFLLSEGTYIDAAEHYVKQTWRNRCRILSPQGIVELTIPVKQGASRECPIRQVEISPHDHWYSRHLQAIKSCYGRTPYYEYYEDAITPLYERQRFQYLFDFCLALIDTIARLIELPLHYELCETYQSITDDDYRGCFDPSTPQMSSDFVPIPYYQLFEGQKHFVPNLSIYDLIFNMGPEARLILRKQNQLLTQSQNGK